MKTVISKIRSVKIVHPETLDDMIRLDVIVSEAEPYQHVTKIDHNQDQWVTLPLKKYPTVTEFISGLESLIDELKKYEKKTP